ncbi:MAG: hypothetical protein IJF71_01910, partial [Clostridia bacterium]|nr:hypothetical protein [Clostridia bacterium]
MFGYLLPDKSYLYIKDYQLYQGVYCGICKSIKRLFGNIPRLATNYDSVFLCVLVHNLAGKDVDIRQENCILHPFKKRGVAADDELFKAVAALNVLLLYHKLEDDVIDDGLLKYKFGRSIFRGAYKKARAMYPEFDRIIVEEYQRLRELELANEQSIDRVADCFGCMMQRVCERLFTPRQYAEYGTLCY